MLRKKTIQRVESKTSDHNAHLHQQPAQAVRHLTNARRLASVSSAKPYRDVSERAAPQQDSVDKVELIDTAIIDGFEELERITRQNAGKSPAGTYEAIIAIGISYIDFARQKPSLFRQMFSQSNDEQNDKVIHAGHGAYNVLIQHVTLFQKKKSADIAVRQAAFPLWTFVHGLSFLLIDKKLKVAEQGIDVPALVCTMTKRMMPH